MSKILFELKPLSREAVPAALEKAVHYRLLNEPAEAESICLDVLRAMGREPESVEVFFEEVGAARGADARLDRFAAALQRELTQFDDIELRARRIVEHMALALQAALLLRHGDPVVADAFCASRLTGDHGLAFGTLPRGLDYLHMIERARPQV